MRMVRRRYRFSTHTLLGLIVGLVCGIFFATWWKQAILPCMRKCCSNPVIPSHMSSVLLPLTNTYEDQDPNLKVKNQGKDLLFIGVMTAQKFLDSRALAVHETWRETIHGEVKFFSSYGSVSEHEVPVIGLLGVDDSYPPQKKSFMMLKYMHDHYIDDYEWFMRADDDVYVKGDKLARFLRGLNSSIPQFIGQAGMGTKQEMGQLSLELKENFCMGGPGIILSRETLKKLVPHISYCLKNLYSTHEDVEIGRCVKRATGIPCTWAFEMQHLFYHNYKKNTSFLPMLKAKEVQRAITLHPVKVPDHLYKIHACMKDKKTMDLRHKTLILQREIKDLEVLVPLDPPLASSLVDSKYGRKPSLMKTIPKARSHVLSWEFIVKSYLYSHMSKNPKRGYDGMTKSSMEDIVTQVMTMINKNAQSRGRTIDFKEILYGYRRVNPLHGVDYILDILLVYRKHKGRKMTIPVRRHAYLQQTFSEIEFREDFVTTQVNKRTSPSGMLQLFQNGLNYFNPGQSANTAVQPTVKKVHVILPLAGRYTTFQRFLLNFETVCLKQDRYVTLNVILYPGDENTKNVALFQALQMRYPTRDLHVIQAVGQFSRATALQLGAAQHKRDDLLFFVDVDIYLNHDSIERIRLNTHQYHTLYFPIVFSQYNPEIGCMKNHSCPSQPFQFYADLGYWRQFGFGIASMYKSDLELVGGYDISIKGWGKEDVQLYTAVINSNLTIYRAVDPGMVHIFHPIFCDKNLDPAQHDMCLGSMAASMASTERLAEIVHNTPEILYKKNIQGDTEKKR